MTPLPGMTPVPRSFGQTQYTPKLNRVLSTPAHQRRTEPARAKPQAESGLGFKAWSIPGTRLRGPGVGATSEERYREKSERPFDRLTYEYAETREN